MASEYEVLKRQSEELGHKLAQAKRAEAEKIIPKIRAQIQEFGITITDLFPEEAAAPPRPPAGKSARAAKQATAGKVERPPKYKDPATGATWTGVGKPPAWISAALRAGKRDDFLIEKVDAELAAKAGASKNAGSEKKRGEQAAAAAGAATKTSPAGKETVSAAKKAQPAKAKKPPIKAAAKKPAAKKKPSKKPAAKKAAASGAPPAAPAAEGGPPVEVTPVGPGAFATQGEGTIQIPLTPAG